MREASSQKPDFRSVCGGAHCKACRAGKLGESTYAHYDVPETCKQAFVTNIPRRPDGRRDYTECGDCKKEMLAKMKGQRDAVHSKLSTPTPRKEMRMVQSDKTSGAFYGLATAAVTEKSKQGIEAAANIFIETNKKVLDRLSEDEACRALVSLARQGSHPKMLIAVAEKLGLPLDEIASKKKERFSL